MEVFRFEIEKKDSETHIGVFGYLDENAQFPKIAEIEAGPVLVFDFENCQMVNSSGIKKWVAFVADLEALPSTHVIFRNCHIAIVNQLNMVRGFLPENGSVESIYLPIYCEKCDREFEILKDSKTLAEKGHDFIPDLEKLDCEEFPGCKSQLDYDFTPDVSLRFLGSGTKK